MTADVLGSAAADLVAALRSWSRNLRFDDDQDPGLDTPAQRLARAFDRCAAIAGVQEDRDDLPWVIVRALVPEGVSRVESPLRPAADPQKLASQLTHALDDLSGQGTRYQGYLSQIVRSCFLAIHDGDFGAPQASLELLAPALHISERLTGSSDVIEAVAWVRSTARLFEVAKEALAPRLKIDALLQHERSDTVRAILQGLLRADKRALCCDEVASSYAPSTTTQVGQILASFHEDGLVVRVKQSARDGCDVAFYRLSRLGRELCEKLGL